MMIAANINTTATMAKVLLWLTVSGAAADDVDVATSVSLVEVAEI